MSDTELIKLLKVLTYKHTALIVKENHELIKKRVIQELNEIAKQIPHEQTTTEHETTGGNTNGETLC